jgi:uncharacterized membrane protein (GlpM family)
MFFDPSFWLALALKMAMTAAIVVAASIVVERSGPFIGAMIAALPTAAGAVYIILAIEHPPAFIASSAIGSLAANAAVAVFALAYAALAQTRGLFVSLGGAIAVWFLCAAALHPITWTPWSALALNAVIFAVTIPAGHGYRTEGAAQGQTQARPSDIALRAATVAICVAIVTTASQSIGSFASGMFAVFPVAMASFVMILHPRIGGTATASVLAHTHAPLVGLGLGFVAVHYLAGPIGVWWSFSVGLAICIAWNGLLWLAREFRGRAAT